MSCKWRYKDVAPFLLEAFIIFWHKMVKLLLSERLKWFLTKQASQG
ncbi:hypothetical protein VCHA43P277_90141 [Vibrio chagasii]|nr:hypothetical protein VCHA34P126_80102 [Vibrio chagasii]CAH7311604.1 hypothetical protein VCHA48O428_40044 [Vibrio chagasii]CAH7400989.1 hypothetical protein VCHA43P277_90141 [Vibrio chagasii]CAH7461297.1 hypothetical protein VCHA50P420_50140 [Vibrio chagasii]